MPDQQETNMPLETAGKVVTHAVDAMKSSPLAIALLIVNIGFLGFAGYVLGHVAANAGERNKSQLELITTLVKDIRDCRQPRATRKNNGRSSDYTTIPVQGTADHAVHHEAAACYAATER